MILLDASAVLAIIFNEPGAEKVVSSSPEFLISTVNYTEAGTSLVNKSYTAKESIKMLRALDLQLVPVEREIAEIAIALRGPTREFGLSLGDRIGIATAKHLDMPVFTADKGWHCMKDIDSTISIRFIR